MKGVFQISDPNLAYGNKKNKCDMIFILTLIFKSRWNRSCDVRLGNVLALGAHRGVTGGALRATTLRATYRDSVIDIGGKTKVLPLILNRKKKTNSQAKIQVLGSTPPPPRE
eukprot:GEMP01081216.1.p1 GENE.GEMP01081216.1~~GEMP01081216.1.p1  ORF type:complete len:112 (+),score=12.65 GEMP01081216.1:477-812(+)